MTTETSASAIVRGDVVHVSPPAGAAAVDAGHDQRWAAWQARAVAADIVTQRHMRTIAVILAVIIGVVLLAAMLTRDSL
jgi:hypothetical protein